MTEGEAAPAAAAGNLVRAICCCVLSLHWCWCTAGDCDRLCRRMAVGLSHHAEAAIGLYVEWLTVVGKRRAKCMASQRTGVVALALAGALSSTPHLDRRGATLSLAAGFRRHCR